MTVDVALQVVNYRTLAYTERCVASFLEDLAGSGLSWTVSVLDNASGDDLGPLRERFGEAVRLRQGTENRGFGAGQNALAGDADARFLLVLNPDVECVEEQTVARLVAAAEREGAAVTGPMLLRPDGRPQRWDHAELGGLRARAALVLGGSWWRLRQTAGEVAWVSGGVMLVDAEAFRRVGGFDEEFFLYREDDDLCRRVREDGGRVWYEAGVRVRHAGSVVGRKSEHMQRSSDYYLRKHFRRRRMYQLRKLGHSLFKRLA